MPLLRIMICIVSVKSLETFPFFMFLKEVSYANQEGCFYWIKNTVISVILWNITIKNNCFFYFNTFF